jgi:HSP20 family protein
MSGGQGGRGPRRPPSVARRLSERSRADAPPSAPPAAAGAAIGGMLGGLQGLVEGLGKLAEAAKAAGDGKRSDIGGGEGRFVFGYSLRTLDGAMQAFGHVPEPREVAAPVAPEARTPIVDVFDETDSILVVAEVPGLDPERLALSVEDGMLLIAGEGAVRYRHRVALGAPVDAAGLTHACRNGILEVRLPRAKDGAG